MRKTPKGSGVFKGREARRGDRPSNCVQGHSKSLIPCRSWGADPPRIPSPLATCPPQKNVTLATPLLKGHEGCIEHLHEVFGQKKHEPDDLVRGIQFVWRR